MCSDDRVVGVTSLSRSPAIASSAAYCASLRCRPVVPRSERPRLTRARERVELWYREPALRAAIESPVRRASGLRERLGSTAGE